MTSVPFRAGEAIAITLGRGGSKGLPGKNLRPLGGHPLIAWAVGAGRCAAGVTRVLCSSDDAAIRAAALAYGAEAPFARPAALAQDRSTDLEVFDHALRWLLAHEGTLPEFVVQLRPTTPFRDPAWIDAAIATMRADPAITCVRSIAPAPQTPYKMWTAGADGRIAPLLALPGVAEPFNLPRQELPEIFWHTGQIDVIRSETILAGSMTGGCLHGLRVPAETAVDIDHAIDLQVAALVFETAMPAALCAWAGSHSDPVDPGGP